MHFSIFLHSHYVVFLLVPFFYGENSQADQMSLIFTLSNTEINPWSLPLSLSLFVFVCPYLCLSFFLFVFVFVKPVCRNSRVGLLQFLRRLMEMKRMTPGNQPLVRDDYPRFSSDCLMIALHWQRPHIEIITQHYPSKLSGLQIIPICRQNYHSSPPPSSTLTFCNTSLLDQYLHRNQTNIKSELDQQKSNNGSMCGNRRGSGEEAEPQKLRAIDTAQCLSWSKSALFPHRIVHTDCTKSTYKVIFWMVSYICIKGILTQQAI